MKVLIDPIYTGLPSRCASTIKMRKTVEYLLSKPEHDLYFYWLIPDDISPEERAWLPASDRIAYLPIPVCEDRYKEYWRINQAMDSIIAFNGSHYDIDVVLSNRTSMIPFMKWAMLGRKLPPSYTWSKKFCLLEDMPIMSFKSFVGTMHVIDQDLCTLLSYVGADMTCISAYWEKKEILTLAKDYLAPAMIRKLAASIHESSPMQVNAVNFKTKESIKRMLDKERPFTISYSGRMVARDKVPESMEIMTKHWVYRGDENLRVLITTQSKGVGVGVNIPKHIEVMRPNREGFWDIMKNESDVGIFMSREEDYSMSMMEPLILGTPLVIHRNRSSEGSIGVDYPFFADNAQQAYAIVRAFHDDYPTNYKRFMDWSKNKLEPMLLARNGDWFPLQAEKCVNMWKDSFATFKWAALDEVTDLLQRKYVEQDTKDLDILKVVESYGDKMPILNQVLREGREGVRITFATPWNLYRLRLMHHFGYKDAGLAPGVLTR